MGQGSPLKNRGPNIENTSLFGRIVPSPAQSSRKHNGRKSGDLSRGRQASIRTSFFWAQGRNRVSRARSGSSTLRRQQVGRCEPRLASLSEPCGRAIVLNDRRLRAALFFFGACRRGGGESLFQPAVDCRKQEIAESWRRCRRNSSSPRDSRHHKTTGTDDEDAASYADGGPFSRLGAVSLFPCFPSWPRAPDSM